MSFLFLVSGQFDRMFMILCELPGLCWALSAFLPPQAKQLGIDPADLDEVGGQGQMCPGGWEVPAEIVRADGTRKLAHFERLQLTIIFGGRVTHQSWSCKKSQVGVSRAVVCPSWSLSGTIIRFMRHQVKPCRPDWLSIKARGGNLRRFNRAKLRDVSRKA